MRVNVWKFILPGVVLGLALVGEPAYGLATLQISDGNTTITVADGDTAVGATDANPATGAVTVVAVIGNFTINVDTGVTKPALGSALLPHLDLSTINIGGPGNLTISFSETGFEAINTSLMLLAGGTNSGGLVSKYDVYYGGGNTLFETNDLVASLEFSAQGAYSGTAYGSVGGATPYSLTQVLTLTFPAGSSNVNFSGNFEVTTPEPASVVLLGGALLVMFGALRRKMRRA